MTTQEREEALSLLGTMAEAIGQEVTPARLLLLLEDIEDLPMERLRPAIAKARKSCKFVPSPKELRDYANAQAVPLLGPPMRQIAAERGKVRESWQGGPPVPTLQEMVDSCFANAVLAERQIATTQERIDRSYDDKQRRELREQLVRHQSDYEHWSGYVGHYRTRAAKEGGTSVPLVSLPTRVRGAA